MRNVKYVVILASLVLGFALSIPIASTARAATVPIAFPTQQAVGAFSGKCIDVHDANSADGTRIDIYTCNGTVAQQWIAPGDGTIQALGKCMDVHDASTDEGTSVDLYTCNGTAAQQWVRASSSGNVWLNPNSGQCLNVTGNSTADGVPLHIWSCTFTDQIAEVWHTSGISGTVWATGLIENETGTCIDVPDSNRTDGTQVQAFTCNNGLNQTWAVPGDGTVRVMGKCLDVRGGVFQAGTPVQIYTCNATISQQWVESSAVQLETSGNTQLCVYGDLVSQTLSLEACSVAPHWALPA